jgi:hypothetical protein
LNRGLPVVAVLLAASESVLVVVPGFGLNVAVTPDGMPDAASVTSPEKPLTGVMVIALSALIPPFAMVKTLGEGASVKLFTSGFTVRLRVAVFVSDPDVPVMVTVAVPVVAVALAVRVSVLLVVPGLGLNAAATPAGKPDAAKVTLLLNPPEAVISTVVVACLLWTRVRVSGLAESAKFGGTPGQLLTRLKAFTVPIPVAKSQPVAAVKAGS